MNILLVEDDPYDVKLLQSALRRAGLDVAWQIVEEEEEFLAALDQPVDVIISDFHLPSFSALRVLELTGSLSGSPPVIVVTGAIDDELAADCIKRGAKDYLLKDRLARIGEAILHVLDQARMDAEKQSVVESLQNSMKQHEILNRLLGHSQQFNAEHAPLNELLSILVNYGPLASTLDMKLDIPGLGIYQLAELDQSEEVIRLELVLGNPELHLGILTVYFHDEQTLGPAAISLLDEFVAVCSNLVMRLRSEKRMRKSIADQEELLREIHHRVMNNLSATRSLINLELGRLPTRACDPILKRLEMRISSMALVHEMLYDYGSYSSINLNEFALALFSRLADGFSCPVKHISLKPGGESVDLPLESAITVGLLLGELFSLSLANEGGAGTVLHLDAIHEGASKSAGWSLSYKDGRNYRSVSAELDLVRTLADIEPGGIEQNENGLRVTFVIHPVIKARGTVS
jgi:DNA-binding response OmpR family regulator